MRSVSSMSDSALILAHRSGDTTAFTTLMDRHRDSVMGFLVNRVGDDAEDLFQETWTRVGTGLETYQEAGSFRAWVFQIARRLVIDHHRRKRARVQLVLPEDHPTPSAIDHSRPSDALAAAEIAEALDTALHELPESTAEVVRMRLIEGRSFNEIASRQGVPMNTALSRMHRGLKSVRNALISRGLIDSGGTP